MNVSFTDCFFHFSENRFHFFFVILDLAFAVKGGTFENDSIGDDVKIFLVQFAAPIHYGVASYIGCNPEIFNLPLTKHTRAQEA